MKKKPVIRASSVVVGSGPGGATIARELARRGESVLILEKGKHHTWPVGRLAAYATMYDIRRSARGVLVRRGITTGGSTMLYSANAYDPPAFLKDELGIDLSNEVAETKKELDIKPVPDFFFKDYTGTRRLVEAAGELGHTLKPQERFIDYTQCEPTCDTCLLGCKRKAKWTAREYLEDAIRLGATLYTQADVQSVIRSGNRLSGLNVRLKGEDVVIEAERVILSAGGIGTPMILKNSGITDAGRHFFTDPMSIVAGVMKKGPGTFREMTFTFADESHEGEFMCGNVGAVNAFSSQIAKMNVSFLRRIVKMKGIAGMFVKLCDEAEGAVDADGTIHKALTPRDETVMARGVNQAKRIMIRAGVDPGTLTVAKGIGGHPGGTAALGRVVDDKLMTGIENLYVCDNSIMPKSGGIPPVLTLIALGKKFARSLAV